MFGKCAKHEQISQKIAIRRVQVYDQRLVVWRLHRFDDVPVRATKLLGQILQRELDILSRHRHAIMPGGVFCQMKCPDFCIICLPALCQGRDEIAGLVDSYQRFGQECLQIGSKGVVIYVDILHLIGGANDQLLYGVVVRLLLALNHGQSR